MNGSPAWKARTSKSIIFNVDYTPLLILKVVKRSLIVTSSTDDFEIGVTIAIHVVL